MNKEDINIGMNLKNVKTGNVVFVQELLEDIDDIVICRYKNELGVWTTSPVDINLLERIDQQSHIEIIEKKLKKVLERNLFDPINEETMTNLKHNISNELENVLEHFVPQGWQRINSTNITINPNKCDLDHINLTFTIDCSPPEVEWSEYAPVSTTASANPFILHKDMTCGEPQCKITTISSCTTS